MWASLQAEALQDLVSERFEAMSRRAARTCLQVCVTDPGTWKCPDFRFKAFRFVPTNQSRCPTCRACAPPSHSTLLLRGLTLQL